MIKHISIVSLVLSGCTFNLDPSKFVEGQSEPTVIEAEVVTMPEEEDTFPITEEDIGEIEATLAVDFTTAWSAAVPFEGTIGEEENFGAFTFFSTTGADIEVGNVTVSIWIDAKGDGVYTRGSEDGVYAADFVSDCVLTDALSRAVIAGPIDPEIGGRLIFGDDFVVGGQYSTAVNVKCTMTGTVPEGATYGIAVDIQREETAIITTDINGNEVAVILGQENGIQNVLELEPAVAVLIASDIE